MFSRIAVTLLLPLALASCGGGGESDTPPPAQPASVTFAFRLRGLPASEEFRFSTTSEAFIAQARAQLALPEAQRLRFVSGPIQAGNGGQNLAWGWHFTDASLVELAIELCDGRPSMVQADLNYWLGTVKSFCPWSSYVHAEVQ
jgi:hypothetical protein